MKSAIFIECKNVRDFLAALDDVLASVRRQVAAQGISFNDPLREDTKVSVSSSLYNLGMLVNEDIFEAIAEFVKKVNNNQIVGKPDSLNQQDFSNE